MTTATSFLASQSGAITVDWTVLTAALTGLGLSAVLVLSAGIESLTGETAGTLAAMDAGTGFAAALDGTGAAEESGAADDAAEAGEEAEAEETAWTPPESTPWNGKKAGNYYGMGAVAHPGNTGADRVAAIAYAAADAPEGFNLDRPLFAPWSNSVVYTSNDGSHYSIDGRVVAVTDGTSYPTQWGGSAPIVAWSGAGG